MAYLQGTERVRAYPDDVIAEKVRTVSYLAMVTFLPLRILIV